jgi:hypothetical protein
LSSSFGFFSSNRRSRRSLPALFAAHGLALTLGLVALGACSGESEGQRCSTTDDQGGQNGVDSPPGSGDCASGLYCYAAGTLGGVAGLYAQQENDPSFGICCPAQRSQATTSICALQPTPPSGDAAPPPGAGASDAGDAGTSDAAGDVEAPDSSSDAPADSPSTG